jgi:hypothetical protein
MLATLRFTGKPAARAGCCKRLTISKKTEIRPHLICESYGSAPVGSDPEDACLYTSREWIGDTFDFALAPEGSPTRAAFVLISHWRSGIPRHGHVTFLL